MRIIQKAETEQEVWSRLNAFRGPLAICIMLSHIWGNNGLVLLVPFNKVVTVCVAVFLFLSGYGMTRSLEKKRESYWKEILGIKIPYLLFMAVVVYLFSCALQAATGAAVVEADSYLPLSAGRFLATTNWYIWELTGFYLAFAAVSGIRNAAIRNGIVLGGSVIAFLLLYRTGVVEGYYNSIFGFSFGMLAASCKKPEIFGKKGAAVTGLILCGVSFALMFLLDTSGRLFPLVRNAAAIGACLLLMYLSWYVSIRCRVIDTLSRVSPEIYFFHIPITLVLSYVISHPYVYLLVDSAVSLAVAFAVHPVNRWINKKWRSLVKGS